MEYDFQVLRLTNDFYSAYPKTQYPEILEKKERAYNCIVFEINSDHFVCIPYRTEIRHQYRYAFKKSARSRQHKSGLDYTKMIIVRNSAYIDTNQAIVDNDEYIETITNIETIKAQVFLFLNDYIKHIQGEALLHPVEYKRRYQYSPLKYFHRELGL
ncbi:MAG: type III toxin-antitoxin system TenpIN family toxin [Cellulosilyticaceae bacterium]